MKTPLTALWRGEVPLARAFWEYTVLYGTLANAITTIASLGAVSAGLSNAVALVIFLLPLPYNILMVAAVWRSAGRYRGRRLWADLARAAVVIWMIAATAV
jgi:hypothetical protein